MISKKTLDKIGSTEKQFLKMLTTNDRIFNIEEYKCPKYNDLVKIDFPKTLVTKFLYL